MKVAGVPCIDGSGCNHMAPGDAGDICIPSTAFFVDCKATTLDIVYIECAPRYDTQEMAAALYETHCAYHVAIGGGAVGDRYNHPRMGGLSLSHR